MSYLFQKLLNKYPSSLGFMALIIWSFSALFASVMKSIPIFEMLSLVFFVSFIVIFSKVTLFSEWNKLKQPIFISMIGLAGIYGNDFFYFEAFKHAPASQVDIINYLWPLLVVFFSFVFTGEPVKKHQVLGCLLSFWGIYVLVAYDSNIPFDSAYLTGYLYAFLDATIWALYVLICRRYSEFDSEAIGVYCMIGMVLSCIAHLSFESFVMPSTTQFLAIILIGIFSQGLAYVFWEKGIKKGNFILLSTSSYYTPLFSIAVLVLFSKAKYSHALLFATLFVTLGAIIVNKKEKVL